MPDSVETAKVKLVTIIAPTTLREALVTDLRQLGVTGYTTARVNGWGQHGKRHFGLEDEPNVRIDTLVSAEVALVILNHMDAKAAESGIVAFALDAEAVPRRHFT